MFSSALKLLWIKEKLQFSHGTYPSQHFHQSQYEQSQRNSHQVSHSTRTALQNRFWLCPLESNFEFYNRSMTSSWLSTLKLRWSTFLNYKNNPFAKKMSILEEPASTWFPNFWSDLKDTSKKQTALWIKSEKAFMMNGKTLPAMKTLSECF